MPIIEGIGDEVTQFFFVVSLLAITTFAWLTTDLRHQWNTRTVYLVNRRRPTGIERRLRNLLLTRHTQSATISGGIDPMEGTSSVEEVPPAETSSSSSNTAIENKPPEPSQEGNTSDSTTSREETPPTSEEEGQAEIVQVMDGVVTLRRRRLAFFENENYIEELMDMPGYEQTSSPANNIVEPTAESSSENMPEETQNITIKLKYINDDLKVVDGQLEELLGDFKRRHFGLELSSNKLVRLIFNGQVLQRDTDTLRSYGMFDNCVVHCLVHQQRTSATDSSATGDNAGTHGNNNNNHRDWDFGNLLIAGTSFILGSAWYFRYQFPQLFTITATVALVAITGIFTVISLGTYYFPDLHHQQHQQQQQQQQGVH